MSADRLGRANPHYDACVVRLWRGEIGDHLARAEHVSSGTRVRAVAVPTTWVLRQILAYLRASPSSDAVTPPTEGAAPRL
jgi:hypothetical protein